jgi:hypothetical protein
VTERTSLLWDTRRALIEAGYAMPESAIAITIEEEG